MRSPKKTGSGETGLLRGYESGHYFSGYAGAGKAQANSDTSIKGSEHQEEPRLLGTEESGEGNL